ncbi:phosphate ABC transporter ATP-binding protein [Rhodobacteraceae bacterium 2376]|uniref:Phosphate ABC transporter ATP-binding protein n=1 Tax=Rhabdonatronobacter sediminivivens TaxID=2743469 RepID=A0A7Z0I1I5_9RHOB|nr:phosphate ABC transporter ATP-binding protein [Rhabdonatronobacter sediminivivens]NYS26125.1 phosphate ABC transporter ATP-binding protein [Rhabdonatronobacter sediminivivens]
MKIARDIAPPILPLSLEDMGYAVGGKTLLSGITLRIEAGQRLVVMGANGAGKSLFLRLCHGLIDPTQGRRRWASDEARAEAQAMVFQRPVLLRRSVAANLDYPLALKGLPRAARRETVARTLDRFGLNDLAERPARLLSGGEQQRLALARAWAMRPQVLFLDEPSSALDPSATRIIEEMVAQFSDEGITIVMTTHDLGQARRLAAQVAFLHRGRLIEHRPAAEFFAGPEAAEARAFLAGDLIW